ncbi:MAG TPA: allantoicase [Jatrophihabitans sp.]|jgi:allantoicase
MNAEQSFRTLPDLAVRSLGGSVVWANDESFAERQHLIVDHPPRFDPAAFGPRGKIYDGWETRRRREFGHDTAIVRLGVPGVIRGVVVDTRWFIGNYPPEASVEATALDGNPSIPRLLDDAGWTTLLRRKKIHGDTENAFAIDSSDRWTHVRLSIYPDGGVARFRVHGEPIPDRSTLGGVDLAALENGGLVVDCSDMFYGSPNNLISPGVPASMADGWETARRRDCGSDWVVIKLGLPGTSSVVELDTSYFVHNAPGWASVRGCALGAESSIADADWRELLPRTRLQPDTRHRFPVTGTDVLTHLRLDIYPDGGMARLRLYGRPDR